MVAAVGVGRTGCWADALALWSDESGLVILGAGFDRLDFHRAAVGALSLPDFESARVFSAVRRGRRLVDALAGFASRAAAVSGGRGDDTKPVVGSGADLCR